ncbi:ABC transporter permease [Reichenbachiella sp. MALMAid0571]|uniref:ABC transporter permease n=1 Tax=Reichenbachiella sp. MALMAid0571 TaxID=3143939 RepID=UPI0032DE36D1
MLKEHLKITIRVFLKNKLFTAINISGLAIGITAYLLITQYVNFESGYDQYHPRIDDLYRVTLSSNLGEKGFVTSATNHPAVAYAMKQDMPEVESYARVVEKTVMWGTFVLSHTNERGDIVKSNANDDRMYIADSSILSLFKIDLIRGNPKTALSDPKTIILSEKVAKRFFGDQDPLDKTLMVNNQLPVKVTGVFKEVPENTHLQFDMLVSFSTLGNWTDNTWIWPEFYNYVRLKPGTDPAIVEAKFPEFVEKYLSDIMQEHGFEARFGLQPVKDIHLTSHHSREVSVNASEQTLNFLMVIAAFVILIALMNFINLSTAKSIERAKEVGIKKVVGIRKWDLISQFLFESMMINLIGMIIAVAMVSVLINPFNELVGMNVLSMNIWIDPGTWLVLFIIFLIGGLLAGVYPAFVLSSFEPIQVLKGKFSQSGSGAMMRKVLVMAQFAISMALIAGTFIVYSQFSYMQNQELGYDVEHNLVVNAPMVVDSTINNTMKVFKDKLMNNPKVNSVTLTNEVPGKQMVQRNLTRKQHERKEEGVVSNIITVDHDFLKTYNIGLLSGRGFTWEDRSSYGMNGRRDESQERPYRVMINETGVRSLGFLTPEEAVNQKIIFKYGPVDRTAEVIGVVEDYHQQSLQKDFEPIIFLNPDFYSAIYMTINMNTSNVKETVAAIGDEFERFFPKDPYKYFFLDDYFNRQYEAEQKFSRICLVFAGLAIFIAGLGLFGLGSYMALQKTKEVSVRKVLGASMWNVMLIMPRNLLGLVLMSGLLALPVTYFMAKEWLLEYAFRIDISIWMFVIPLFAVLLVAALSVLPQSIRVGLVNPIESLRDE